MPATKLYPFDKKIVRFECEQQSISKYHTYKAQISVDGWTDISVPLKGEQSNKNTSCFSQ